MISQNYNQDKQYNVIELQKSAKISGRAIDPNGNSMKNTPLTFYSFQVFPPLPLYEDIVTDSNGFFVIEDVREGLHLLSVKRGIPLVNRSSARIAKEEHIGPIGYVLYQISEGQEIKESVLNFSKSTAALELRVTDKRDFPVTNIIISIQLRLTIDNRARKFPPNEPSNIPFTIYYKKHSSSIGIYLISKLPAGKFHVQVRDHNNRSRDIVVELSENSSAKYQLDLY